MKRLALLAAALTVAVLSAVPFGAFASSEDYRSWLLENGATPVIAGGTAGTTYHAEYPPAMAFDGLKDTDSAHRYLGSIQNGAYLIYGGDVSGKTFTTTHYRVWQLTCGALCNDRVPTAWTLYGSDAKDGPWAKIESRSDVKWSGTPGQSAPAPALSDCWREFKLATPQTYKFYKIAFTASKTSDTWSVGVMEVEFRNVVEASWKGARADSDVDWSLASNWDGAVPTGNAKVTIAYDDNCRMLTMTPPLDFTGTIICGGDDRDWAAGVDSTLRLNVLDGATWTIGHCTRDGTLVATAGLDARIGADFQGMVVVPHGVSFTAASTLNDNLEFAGDGALTLTKAAQLNHIQAFIGTVVWNGGTSLSPEDTAALQRHKVRLANGQSLTLPEKMLSLHAAHAIPDFAQTASWGFNGGAPFQSKSSAYTFDANPPSVNANGELELINDCGQKHSVVFKDHKFGMADTWGVHFSLKCDLPSPEKYPNKTRRAGGYFGVYLLPATDTVSTTAVEKDGPTPPVVTSGFCLNMWSSSMQWQLPGDSDRYLSVDGSARSAVGGAVNLAGKVDFDVTFAKGLMVVTVSQGDQIFAFRRTRFDSASTRAAFSGSYYLALGGSGTWYGDKEEEVSGSMMTISDFRGWYRSREAGAWTTVANQSDFYPFTADKWRARRYTNSSTYDEGAAAIESDGSFLLQPESTYRRTLLGSLTALSPKKRYLFGWDLVGGNGVGDVTTEGIAFGLVANPENSYNSWIFDYARLEAGWFNDYCRAFGIAINPDEGSFRFRVTREKASGQFEVASSPSYSWPKKWPNQTLRTQYFYDGDGGFYLQMASLSAAALADAHYIPEEKYRTYFDERSKIYLCFENNQTWGYTKTAIKDLVVKELTGNSSPYLSGTLEVAQSATATMSADAYDTASSVPATKIREVALAAGSTLNVATAAEGSKVAIDTLRVMGDGATLAATAKTVVGGLVFEGESAQTRAANLSGDVAFADGTLTIVMPESWRHSTNPVPLFKGAKLPASCRILTNEGQDITKRVSLTVRDGEVVLSRKGLLVVFK